MRPPIESRPLRRPLPNVFACGSFLLLAACADAARIAAPSPDTRPALASKQGTTNGRILFTREHQAGIFSMDDDGNNVVELASAGLAIDPAWAPDGKRIIYAAVPEGLGPHSIFVMSADGSGVTRLTYPTSNERDGQPRALAKRIVFLRVGTVEVGNTIWVMNADGTNLTPLTNGPDDQWPAPSPDGKQVAFVRNHDIHVIDVATRAVTNLTNTDAFESYPSWSPGGKRIAFTWSRVGEGYDIWTMNANGTALNNLSQTHPPFFNEFVGAWTR